MLDIFSSFFLLIRRPMISTLFPYTTLFRSHGKVTQIMHGASRNYRYIWDVSPPGCPIPPIFTPRPKSLDTRTPLPIRSEEHTSELQSRPHLVCRLLLEKKKGNAPNHYRPAP